LIIVYPQVKFSLGNFNSCFDYIGYTEGGQQKSESRQGVQSIAVKNMIKRVTGPRDPQTYNLYAGNILDGNFIETTIRDFTLISDSWPDYVGLVWYFIYMLFFGWLYV